MARLLTKHSDALVDDHDPNTPFLLEVHTREGGFNSGKIYVFTHRDKTLLEDWAAEMGRLSVKCQKMESSMAMSSLRRWQRKIAWYARGKRVGAAEREKERRGRSGERRR